MGTDNTEMDDFFAAFVLLTPEQQASIRSAVNAFLTTSEFERDPRSDIVTDAVMHSLGNQLLVHHAGSRQALSKDRFEFAFEAALNQGGIPARLVKSRTNRGHDIDINGVPVNLKTEASSNIKDDYIHVSKWMELGRGEWRLDLLLALFLEHLKSYERIFTLRRLLDAGGRIRYELVEIPKALLLEAADCELSVSSNSRQVPQPGYGHVKDELGNLKFSLYFDGGSERKLQIKYLRKDLCWKHAIWEFDSTPH